MSGVLSVITSVVASAAFCVAASILTGISCRLVRLKNNRQMNTILLQFFILAPMSLLYFSLL